MTARDSVVFALFLPCLAMMIIFSLACKFTKSFPDLLKKIKSFKAKYVEAGRCFLSVIRVLILGNSNSPS